MKRKREQAGQLVKGMAVGMCQARIGNTLATDSDAAHVTTAVN